MNALTVAGITIPLWIYLPLVYLLWVTAFLMLKKVLFRAIGRMVSRTESRLDDLLIHSLNLPLTLLIFSSGGALVESLYPVAAEEEITRYFFLFFKAATIVAVVLFCDKFIIGLIRHYSAKVEILRASGGVVHGLVRFAVLALGVLILMDSFGISVTPVIASLGIGSLAVALALQPTLENFFSGVQIMIDKPIKVGQFVKLDSGEEGYIHRIGWRSTWVRMLPNNVVVLPNKVLVNSKVTNYYYPDKDLAVLVQVGVHYESDLEHVERVTIEVGREVMTGVAGGVKEFTPFIRYHTFDDFSINFTVILRAREFVDNYLIKHEFIKRLHKRYAREGIVIPYPIRAVNYEQEKAFVKKGAED